MPSKRSSSEYFFKEIFKNQSLNSRTDFSFDFWLLPRLSTKENTLYGTLLMRMMSNSRLEDISSAGFNIIDGNVNDTFEILG